ncbi:MAG: undecaprenyl-diphosphate phosphatase [Thermoguttaceae bacterium]|nr:undecaprenyl-diphosphate phosphatase [Thermoguttaceae bacterium]
MDLVLIFRVVLLAVIQGIAEFLPISSSGHLLVLGRLFEMPDVFLLTILLHFGTLFSVLVFFLPELTDVVLHRQRAIALVIVGTIPTVAIAFAIQKFFPQFETSRLTAGVCFILTGLMLVTILRRCSRTESEEYYEKIAYEEEGVEPPVMKTIENTTWFDAFFIGIAQGLAVFPGLSRSGSTISAGVLRRLKNQWAAEFSFYLSIPVIAGGAVLEILKVFKEAGKENIASLFQLDSSFAIYLGGAFVSFVVGYVALFSLMQMLKAGKLHYFAIWLFFIGAATLAWTGYDHWDQIVHTVNSMRAQ